MVNPNTGQFSLDDLRKKVSWLFFGTRDYGELDAESKAIVDDIVNDGYQCFLVPPPAPGERRSHKWNFLRPIMTITLVSGQEDYDLSEDFGGLDGPLFYARSDNRLFPLTKVDPHKILAQRQRDSLSISSQPTEFAVVTNYPDGRAKPASTLMVWPSPDDDYVLKGRYFVMAAPLTDENPYPVCPALHNQCLLESVLAKAEERLEDAQGVHAQNFLIRLSASVTMDRDQYSPDHLGLDVDRGDEARHGIDYTSAGDYVSYNGYTPGV